MKDLSIITINLNHKEGLIRTINSVKSQKFSNYEFIVIDGCSVDGSLDVIEENKDYITTWMSEKDGGIWDAMNKGIKLAKGKFVHILNSGDCYFDNNALNNINFETNKQFICMSTLKLGTRDWVWLPRINMKSNFVNVSHPGLIVKKDFYKNIMYSTSYDFVSDNLFIYKNVTPVLTDINDHILVKMESGGVGSSVSISHEKEKHSLLLKEGVRKPERLYLHLVYIYFFLKNSLVKLFIR